MPVNCSRAPFAQLLPIALLASVVAGGCAYDPPPEPTLVYTELGVYLEGEPLVLSFSEPFEPSTLLVRLWEPSRTDEGELEATEFYTECRPTDGSCDGMTITVVNDTTVELTLAEEYAQPGKLGTIEVAEGLSDHEENATGVPYLFDYIYFPAGFAQEGSGDAEYVPGHYLLRSPFEVAGIQVDLKLIVDIPRVNDAVAVFGYVGEKNKENPEGAPVVASVDERICAVGKILSASGATFLFTEPVNMKLTYSGIPIDLQDTAIFASPTVDPETGLPLLKGALVNKKVCLFGNKCLGGANDPPNFAPFDAFFYEEGTLPEGAMSFCEEACATPAPVCDAAGDFDCATFCP